MSIELGTAYVSVVASGRGIQNSITKELAPVSAAAALEGDKAGRTLGGRLQKGLSGSLSKLGNFGATLGVPFAGALGAVGASMDNTSTKAAGLASSLGKIGKVEAIAGVAGLAIVGKAAVSAAQDFEVAQARLSTALQNQGTSFAAQREGIEQTNTSLRKLGFTDTETESSLAKLTGATHDAEKAQRLMSLAADTARATNSDLATATQLLVNIEAGRFKGLAKLGISTKDAAGNTITATEAFRRLNEVVGGQGAAFAGTFQGKLASLRAEADRLEVTLGEALIPKIEALASGTLGAIHGFERANSATDGFLGKAVALGAALPVAVFAAEKLGAVRSFIAGQYAKVGATLTTTTVATEAQTVADQELAVAEGEAAAGASGLTLALAAVGVGLIAGKVAGDAINDMLVRSKPNVDQLTASLIQLSNQKGPSPDQFDFGRIAGDLNSQVGSGTINPIKGLQAFTPGAHQAKADIDALNEAFKNLLATEGPVKASQAFARFQKGLEAAHGDVFKFLGDMAPFLGALDLAGSSAHGAADGVNAAGAAANAAQFGYLNLAASVTTAADALAALQTRAEKPLRLQIAAQSARATADQAVQDFLNPPDTGGGGGGGSTQTSVAADLEHRQQILSVRDAERGLADATQGVQDAEIQLADARANNLIAQNQLTAATQNYRNVLQGVGKDAKAAKDALDDLSKAKTSAAEGRLGVREAQRNLAQAKNDKALFALNVKAAEEKLAQDRKGGAGGSQFVPGVKGSVQAGTTAGVDADQIRRDEIALNDARIAASGADDSVRQAELDLQRARESAKDSTKAATEAQRIYNGTVHGFPPHSKEAQTAQENLTTAQRNATQAAHDVATAERGVATAIDQIATAALALDRAHADVAGQLDAIGGAATRAGGHAKTSAERFRDLESAALDAGDAAARGEQGLGHSLAAQLFAQIQALQTYVSAVPLLAATFGPIIANLEAQMLRELAKHPPPVQRAAASAAAAGVLAFGEGGVVPGPKGKPQWAIVHGGETVVPAQSLANSVPLSAGGASPINIYGDVYGYEDFKRKVAGAIVEHGDRTGGLRLKIRS